MLQSISRMLALRLVAAIPLILLVVTLTFFLIRLAPGDPAYALAGGDAPSDAYLESVRQSYGLDQPLLTQYLTYLKKAASLDFGQSIYYRRPVFEVILDRFPATLLLAGAAMVLATIVGVLLAVWSAHKPGSFRDGMITSVALVGFSVPVFWVGQLMILAFAIQLGWFPVGGYDNPRMGYTGLSHVMDVAHHMVLPTLALALYLMAMITRITRTSMIDVLGRNYVNVARAKGVSPAAVTWFHAFRVAVVSTITIVGVEFGTVIIGAVLTETIFSWPGLGRLFYDAILKRDFPLLTGSFIFTAVMVVVVNALTDVLCAIADPRLRS
ncbi:ABC transporter permease [Antarctobacter sp.]|uniref:ABC transporter permease n=1 Tax=Antarctobacter sp. TaxID=1872577 RepID=UPI003A8EAC1E